MIITKITGRVLKKIYHNRGIKIKELSKFDDSKKQFDVFLKLCHLSDEGYCYILDDSDTLKIIDLTASSFMISGDWRVFCTERAEEYVEKQQKSFYRWVIPIVVSSLLSLAAIIISAVSLIVSISSR